MTPIAPNTLAIDAGQTGIRIMHVGGARSTIRDFAGIHTDRPLLPQLVAVVEQFCAETSLPVQVVAAGVSGLTASESRAETLLAGVTPLGVTAVYLAHDSISGFLGSLGMRPGAVVAAGTGVVTLGVGPAGITRVDGWGHIMGDAGSGYWIGRAALDAAMRSHDGRAEQTSLTFLLEENFTSPEAAYIELQTNPDRVRFIASFAKQVVDHAESDGVAREIIRRAGSELALSVATALRRVGLLEKSDGTSLLTSEPHVSWAGALLSGEILHADFEQSLRTQVPNVILSPPLGMPLNGVALLPSLQKDSPLLSAVAIAGTSTL
jgi:glucosamine kinase